MATVKRLFVFSTSILSGIATLFIIISLSTEQWIVCKKAEYIDLFVGDFASIQYGLFQGTINTKRLSPRTLVLSSKFETIFWLVRGSRNNIILGGNLWMRYIIYL